MPPGYAWSIQRTRLFIRPSPNRVGASTGTNLWGAFGLLAEMVADARSGSVVTLLADTGDRYADTYFCDEWVKAHELDISAPAAALTEFERSGHWD
jgi:cysteine synthase A